MVSALFRADWHTRYRSTIRKRGGTGFPKRSCSKKRIERDDYSRKVIPLRTDGSRAYRTPRLQSAQTHCTARRYGFSSRCAGITSARGRAGGLPPIVGAWRISNAAWATYGISFAPARKASAKIAIRMLSRTPIAVKNSLGRNRARILFVRIWSRLDLINRRPAGTGPSS